MDSLSIINEMDPQSISNFLRMAPLHIQFLSLWPSIYFLEALSSCLCFFFRFRKMITKWYPYCFWKAHLLLQQLMYFWLLSKFLICLSTYSIFRELIFIRFITWILCSTWKPSSSWATFRWRWISWSRRNLCGGNTQTLQCWKSGH